MMVDAKSVVAQPFETLYENLRKLMVGKVRGAAQIEAVELLTPPGEAFKLEVSVDVLEPAVLSCRGVDEAHPGEIERTPLNDISAIVDRNPLRSCRHNVWPSVGGNDRRRRSYDE